MYERDRYRERESLRTIEILGVCVWVVETAFEKKCERQREREAVVTV